MAKIAPFEGLRPKRELADKVASLPYDVLSEEEARVYRDQKYSFYHITRSEIDLPKMVDVHSPTVYEQANDNLKRFIKEGILVQDQDPYYYIYRMTMKGRMQTGLVCTSSIEDYRNGIIKKHEFTRPEKEKDRIEHIKATRAQTGIVLLTYREVRAVTEILDNYASENEPEVSFVAEDKIKHEFWVIRDYGKISNITRIFEEEVPFTYIADGHHRAASASEVAEEFRSRDLDLTGNESFNYFLTCIFPSNQMRIMDYNRVVKDLSGNTPEQFLDQLQEDFTVTKIGDKPFKPKKHHQFGLYLGGNWYRLEAKKTAVSGNLIDSLDVSMLQNNVLDKILGIKDPRTNDRLSFVGGIRGLEELVRLVDSGDWAAAFACYPVSLDQLLSVADSGQVMPPKSTWFEPKTRDGLVTHLI